MFSILASAFLSIAAAGAHGQVAVRGDLVHTMTGPPIRDGVILVREGKITAVGPAAAVQIPEGFRVLHAPVVTPGLIDAHSTVGLSGIYNQSHDQDQLERSSPIQPELRAVDAYNPHEQLVEYVRGFGVTTLHTGHAPGELVSGQTIIVKSRGNTVEEALLDEAATVAATLSPMATKEDKAPGTRAKMMAMLREELIRTREYIRRRAAPEADAEPAAAPEPGSPDGDAKERERSGRSLRHEVLGRVLAGELPLMITAHRAQDIANVLRLAEEFGIKVILDGGAEAYLLADELAAAGVPVIAHPTMMRAYGEAENASFETAATLRRAGITVALQSGYEGYVPKTRVVLFEAGLAAAHGLSFDEALATITIDAARILGVEGRVGSLEVGKDADMALFDGDPFEYTTHCLGVVIDGQAMEQEPR